MKQHGSHPGHRPQRGAVAILLGFSIFVLFGFMALAIDLGRTYVVRTELQNAADAAALAGAKDLNQKPDGVTKARQTVKDIGLQNNTKFSFKGNAGITISDEMIWVGSCPDDVAACNWMLARDVNSDALAAGKTFLKVYIPSGDLVTFFARVPTTADGTGTPSTRTYGLAVAGPFVTQISPIGVCAIDPDTQSGVRPSTAGDELTEFGFRRGIAYNIPELNPLAHKGVPLWINPIDAPPDTCDPSNSSATALKPFLCTGTTIANIKIPGNVYVNTGGSYGPMEKALNSRFDDLTGGNACDPATAPPDFNVKSYTVPAGGGPGPAGNPRDWTQQNGNTYPSRQSIAIDPATNKPVTTPTIDDYGALWSYSRAVKAVGTPPTAGDTFDLVDWPSLYAGNTADQTASGYPGSISIPPFPAGTLEAPYNTLIGNKYFDLPPVHPPGKRDRRVLNVVIVDCRPLELIPGPGLSCAALPALAVGKFFMQTKADFNGSPKIIYGEFAGLFRPLPPPEVRLYR